MGKQLKQAWYLLISFAVIFADQSLKYYIKTNFRVGETREVLPGVFSFNYLQNNGAAWNLLAGKMWIFYIITLIASIVVIYYLFNLKYQNITFDIGLALIFGGVIGNFMDRLQMHYVVDMFQLDFINFNIFNIADMAISVGLLLVFIYLIFLEDKKKTK
ncbi:signal peptidase II [Lactobacillus sp. PV037]|uniref:signal peptidase II n=1 Tax=unclassified Lactobacillus TaxID=2620435 RepID=UPI00223F2401|nr:MULTISPECIES: signal peptidase II [unclassified Lactobacillus]QNQ82282.1 signal peptidase II [Lactobacillus sp. PV012]QNQ83607.1 signal peptidase II [Lactobacillus sp. PV037]